MRASCCRSGGVLLPLAALLSVMAVTACRTTPRVDWNSRVGHFTYDQAVVELGPPDKAANLTDGTVVAEWLTARGSHYGTVYPVAPFWWTGQVDLSQGPDFFLRLTFGPDRMLRTWKKVAR